MCLRTAGLDGLTYVDPDEDYDTQRDLESCVDSGTLKLGILDPRSPLPIFSIAFIIGFIGRSHPPRALYAIKLIKTLKLEV